MFQTNVFWASHNFHNLLPVFCCPYPISHIPFFGRLEEEQKILLISFHWSFIPSVNYWNEVKHWCLALLPERQTKAKASLNYHLWTDDKWKLCIKNTLTGQTTLFVRQKSNKVQYEKKKLNPEKGQNDQTWQTLTMGICASKGLAVMHKSPGSTLD